MTGDMSGDMPRGGPGAARWDRRYETCLPEYIDLPGDEARARRVLRGLDRFQRLTGAYRNFSRLTLAEVRDVPDPRILELGAGLGRLARHLLDRHPTARLTVSDAGPHVVEAIRSGPLGRHPRVTTARLDATSIAAPDGAFDVAVFTMSLHHLRPAGAAAVLREGTRVARRLLIIDGWRHPAFLAVVPLMFLTGGRAHAHDGFISLRKVYGAAALHALADGCRPRVAVRTRFAAPGYLVATATATAAPAPAPDPAGKG